MQLLHFCLLFSAFAGILLDELFVRPSNEFCLSWCFGFVFAVGCLGKFAAFYAGRKMAKTQHIRSSWNRYNRQLHSLLWIWCVVAPCYLTVIGWGACAKMLVPGVESSAWLFAWWCFPTILVLTLLDAARYQMSRALGVKTVRRIQFGWMIAFVPCFASCFLWDCSIASIQGFSLSEGLTTTLAACFMSLVMAIGLPALLTRLWSTERLDRCTNHQELIKTWVDQGGSARAVLRWKTNSTIASAMVVGWFSPFRFLLLSDLLLERLSRDELRMIVLHEAAHCRRWHVWLRMLPILFVILPVVAIQNRGLMQHGMSGLDSENPLIQAFVTLISIVSMGFLLSWIARWTELDADRVAVELAGGQRDNSESIVQNASQRRTFDQRMAARVLIRALEKLVPVAHAKKETWLHPSLERRIHSLLRRYFNERLELVESIDDIGCFSSPL